MKKRIAVLCLSLVMLTAFLYGCAPEASTPPSTVAPSNAPVESAPPVQTEVESDKAINIVMWHSMGGRNGEAIDAMVKAFNESQDKVVLEAQYQGTYDDAITKLRSTAPGEGPDIMQLYDIGTRWMIDSGYALTMQDFIDADKYDISDYEANILSYYTLDGKLYSMPFNCSSPVILYNKEAVAAAGLDPMKDFASIEAMQVAAQTLVEKGGVSVGGSLPNYSWVFEQFVSMQDKDFLDNNNGRTDRATKMVIGENGAGLTQLSKWKEFAASPYTETYGKGTAESKKQFANGTVGFIIDSCSVYVDSQAAAEGIFNVGFAPLPTVSNGDTGGVSVGGGSLWIMDNKDANKASAAWQFIKFGSQPEQQAHWSIGTGYVPIRKSAVDVDFYADYLKNTNPELIVAIEALRSSKPTNAGSVMGVFPKARVIIENEVETMINDANVTPEQTLDNIIAQINEEIEMYNKTN